VTVVRALAIAGLLYALAGLLVYLCADRLIFLPPPSSYRDTPAIVKLAGPGGGAISAVHLVNPAAEYTILYSHGNAEDLGMIAPILARLRDWGFSVLAYDYPGYGTSAGLASERGVYAAANAAFRHLTERAGVPAERIIAYGRSVGSGPAVELARRERLAGLVVESGFATAFRVMVPIPVLPFDRFRNIDKIARV
jgi:alpha-beta hydrolase superfamily lysophospholipase